MNGPLATCIERPYWSLRAKKWSFQQLLQQPNRGKTHSEARKKMWKNCQFIMNMGMWANKSDKISLIDLHMWKIIFRLGSFNNASFYFWPILNVFSWFALIQMFYAKVPILQVVFCFGMNLWSVEHFFDNFFHQN